MTDDRIDMDRIAQLVTEQGVPAYVEQTGGGTATIYAGQQVPSPYEHEDFPRWTACAGPGTYGWGREPSRAWLADFVVGPDIDDGYTYADEVGAHTEEQIAALIVAQAKRTDLTGLSADDVEALGLDPTGRSARG